MEGNTKSPGVSSGPGQEVSEGAGTFFVPPICLQQKPYKSLSQEKAAWMSAYMKPYSKKKHLLGY